MDDGLCGDDTLFYLIDKQYWLDIYRLVICIYQKALFVLFKYIERGISPSSNMRIYSSSVVQVEKKASLTTCF